MLNQQNDKYYFISDDYPSANVSLRATTPNIVTLKCITNQHAQTIGEIDASSASWFVHPGAIYLHDADTYKVNALDIDKGECLLEAISTDYYTIPPNLSTSIENFSVITQEDHQNYQSNYGNLSLKFEINSFKKNSAGIPTKYSELNHSTCHPVNSQQSVFGLA